MALSKIQSISAVIKGTTSSVFGFNPEDDIVIGQSSDPTVLTLQKRINTGETEWVDTGVTASIVPNANTTIEYSSLRPFQSSGDVFRFTSPISVSAFIAIDSATSEHLFGTSTPSPISVPDGDFVPVYYPDDPETETGSLTDYDSVFDFISGSENHNEGDTLLIGTTQFFTYTVVSSSESNYHVMNQAGVRLIVNPDAYNRVTCSALAFVTNTDVSETLRRFLANTNGCRYLIVDGVYWLKDALYSIPDTLKAFVASDYTELSHGEEATQGFLKMDFVPQSATANSVPVNSREVFITPSGFSCLGLRFDHNVDVDASLIVNGGNYVAWLYSDDVDHGLTVDKCRFDHEGGTSVRYTLSPNWRFTSNYVGLQKQSVIITEGSSFGTYAFNRGRMGFLGLNVDGTGSQIHGDYIKVFANSVASKYCNVFSNQFINDFRDGPDGTGGFEGWVFDQNYFEVAVAGIDIKTTYNNTADLLEDKRNQAITITNNIFVGCGTVHTFNWDEAVLGAPDFSLSPRDITYSGNVYLPSLGKNTLAHHFKGCGFTSCSDEVVESIPSSSNTDGFIAVTLIRVEDNGVTGGDVTNVVFDNITWDARGQNATSLTEARKLSFNFSNLITNQEVFFIECEDVLITGNITTTEKISNGAADVFGVRAGCDHLRLNINALHDSTADRGALIRCSGVVGSIHIDGFIQGYRECVDNAGAGNIQYLYLGKDSSLVMSNLTTVISNPGIVQNVLTGVVEYGTASFFLTNEPENHDMGRLFPGSGERLDISSDTVSVRYSVHSLDTESQAATDDLSTLNGGTAGDVLTLFNTDSARTISVNNSGNIVLTTSPFLLSTSSTVLVLEKRRDNNWYEVRRS